MITSILVTGEGCSDMGGSNNGQSISTGEFYNLGPMALLAVRLLQKIIPDWNEDNIDFQSPNNWMTCISGNELARQAKGVRKHRPSTKLKKVSLSMQIEPQQWLAMQKTMDTSWLFIFMIPIGVILMIYINLSCLALMELKACMGYR